nr:DUF1848 family protein [Anaerocolumna cellulosilytica]
MPKEVIRNKRQTTVISASRRTDIPAFYYTWLLETLEKGSITLPNPRFENKYYEVELQPDKVHSIVLWSKNFKNLQKEPGYLKNYNLYFQYTINQYSNVLEPYVPDYGETLQILDELLKCYKPEQFTIRFDPVIISLHGEKNPTLHRPEQARLLAFERLCRDLKTLGMEKCRVTTSYLDLYGHMKHIINDEAYGIISLTEERQVEFFKEMASISYKYGFSLYSCASLLLERVEGIKQGHCIDGEQLMQFFGGRVKKSKDNGQRKDCGCTHSRDIGIYAKGQGGMKCYHGCKYCYVMGNL